MNKKLIAAAVAAGLVLPGVAMADATVYGKINVGIVSYDNDDAGASNDGISVFDEASRLGVKGEEDLGNGLKALFKMEATVDMDNGNISMNRDQYVGLGGGWGNVLVGHFNTAYKNATGKYDLFADRWGDITGTGTHGDFDRRESNQVAYNGKFGNVKFGFSTDFSETADNTATTVDENANGYTIAVNVPFGAFEVAAAYAVRGGSAGAAEGDTGTKLGFMWKGPVQLNLVYEQFVDDSLATNDTTTPITLQVGFKMGDKNMLAAGYTTVDVDGNDNDCTQLTAGWMHKLSKKTEVNVIYSAIDNDAASTCKGRFNASVGYNAGTTAAGSDPAGLAVGIQHNF